MYKQIITYILSFVLLITPVQTIKSNQYTIYIPDEPDSVIIYYHCNSVLPHTNKEKPKHPFNFQESIANKILTNNQNSITIVTYEYSEKLVKKVDKLIEEYDLTDVIISGWSAGGNNAVRAAATLANDKRNI